MIVTNTVSSVPIVSSTGCSYIGGVWQSKGTYDPITVTQNSNSTTFTATALSGFTNVPGTLYPQNNTIYLDCCKSDGIYGTINNNCSHISWNDGVGSEWYKPYTEMVTFYNNVPRVDDQGNILEIQDGCLAYFNNIYYLYGAHYQCCPVSDQPGCYNPCGWRNTTFAVYSSFDMNVWHLESLNIFPIVTDPSSPHSNTQKAYFEPCGMYSAAADHYVLWFLIENTKAVAVSDSPIGPFESVSWDIGLPQGSDAYFWTDPVTSVTYMKHNGPPPPGEDRGAHYVSQLSPDLLSIVPNATSPAMMVPALPVPPYYQGAWPSCSEGGGMFSINSTYFVMAGTCCCFCEGGANGFVWTSTNPLGPYTLLEDIIGFNSSIGKYLTEAQQFSVAAIPTVDSQVPVPMYIGQRFGSALDGLKCHDFQYWYPLSSFINGNGTMVINPIVWIDEFTLPILVLPSNVREEVKHYYHSKGKQKHTNVTEKLAAPL